MPVTRFDGVDRGLSNGARHIAQRTTVCTPMHMSIHISRRMSIRDESAPPTVTGAADDDAQKTARPEPNVMLIIADMS